MDLYTLQPGDKVRTTGGDIALVLRATEDGQWILVRYLDSAGNPSIVGTEDLCHDDEVEVVLIRGGSN